MGRLSTGNKLWHSSQWGGNDPATTTAEPFFIIHPSRPTHRVVVVFATNGMTMAISKEEGRAESRTHYLRHNDEDRRQPRVIVLLFDENRAHTTIGTVGSAALPLVRASYARFFGAISSHLV
jgi:hypothetical protein